MIKKILQGITFFVLIVFSLSSFCQQIDENILLKRFRAYHEYDSVSGIVGVDSVMLYAKQKEIIEIDNKIFGDYIVSKDLEGKKSRVNILIDQVNTLDEELFYKSERLLLLYMISAFFIIGFGVFLFLYLQLSKKFSRTYDEFERYRDDIEFQKESFDSREDLNDEHVEEFQSALSNYKQELR
ncbi:MAG: hypothetical protein U9R32_08385, partial [Bacteroidota bacterium]|nr:hypothetical protein [Bacteroidota bacterium]